jgi:hypothetical protein
MIASLNYSLTTSSVCRNWIANRLNGFLLLFSISFVVFAATNGMIKLPESYRTPLSDMVYDEHQEWRTPPEDENPWRGDEEELIINPRLKTEFFPEWDYGEVDDPTTRSLFQNEYELERPRTNIFKYTF